MTLHDFERTLLWKSSLAWRDDDEYSHERERLRSALLDLRANAELGGQTIAHVLPDLTLHDVTHSDALWGIADEIAGEEIALNPVEAFVLGAAFYTHDLALGLAAFPDGADALRPLVDDALAAHRFQTEGRWPADEELAGAGERERRFALLEVLRSLHAERAEDLLKSPLPHPEGRDELYLLDDRDLRERYASMIGAIAYSHSWPVDRLREKFVASRGGPGWAPQWPVDRLLLACLLRLADAANVDERRTPALAQAMRPDMASESHDHWSFQRRLQPARRNGDRLEFSSADGFPPTEAAAWWLCYETLRMVDGELHQVDALLSDLNHARLAARGVAGVDSPTRLTAYVAADGWEPVDARVHVFDVPKLVRQLGGEELYGADMSVPLRELIQNGADAVRARRVCEQRDGSYGTIAVRVGSQSETDPSATDNQGDEGRWIEVEDNGLGMSLTVLQRFLLSFGTSYWSSSDVSRDFPDLTRKRFVSTGRYGIGFFSVFMWGDRVKVATRRFDQGQASTRVLEFDSGVGQRPIVRPANAEERLRDGGTRVRVWLPNDKLSSLFKVAHPVPADADRLSNVDKLAALCRHLAPALDVNIDVETGGENLRAVTGGDWLTMSSDELYSRLGVSTPCAFVAALAPDVLETSDGQVVGRGAIPLIPMTGTGVAVIGGLRASSVSHFDGILLASPVRAARDFALPLASLPDTTRWANLQAAQAIASDLSPNTLLNLAEPVRALGGSVRELPLARANGSLLKFDEIVELLRRRRAIRLVHDVALWMSTRKSDATPNIAVAVEDVRLDDDVLVIAMTTPIMIQYKHGGDLVSWPGVLSESFDTLSEWGCEKQSIHGAVIEAASEAWGVTVSDVVIGYRGSYYHVAAPIGTYEGKSLSTEFVKIMRPGSPEAITHQRTETAMSIVHEDGAATTASLAQELGVSASTVARLLKPYVERGTMVKVKGGYERR